MVSTIAKLVSLEMFDGFSQEIVTTDNGAVFLRRRGTGPPVLLLHGFPETHVAWHLVAPALAERFTVIAVDLPGYGRSTLSNCPEEPWSKRRMASALVSAMKTMGMQRWSVAGHDRGARVAYRMALDHPGCIERLAVLDVVPTLDMADRCSYELASNLVNWFFLAQPAPLPERLIAAAGDFYVNEIIDRWLGPSASLDPRAREAYLAAFRDPAVVHAVCEEYRAGSTVDIAHDRDDRDAARQLACPVLVLWSADDLAGRFFDPLATWRKWTTNVRGRAIPAGHFLMEEAPETVADELMMFLTGDV
jgi:haloacetate dehalogenase